MSNRATAATTRFAALADGQPVRVLDTRRSARRPPTAASAMSLLVSTFVLASAASASGEEISGRHELDLNVHGRIDQRCSMGTIDNVDFGDLTRPGGRAHARVALDCNVPISVTVSAAHGGLANDHYPQGQGPYAGTLPYSLGVAVPVRHPWESVVLRRFESSQLVGAGQTFTTGDGIAVDGMNLDVALGRPSGDAGLLAGSYSETIEITVTPG